MPRKPLRERNLEKDHILIPAGKSRLRIPNTTPPIAERRRITRETGESLARGRKIMGKASKLFINEGINARGKGSPKQRKNERYRKNLITRGEIEKLKKAGEARSREKAKPKKD